ncbi:MAG: DUF4199 domain-containing protein [Bacteroidota bacterium]
MKSIVRYGVISGLVVVIISLLIRAFGSGDWSYQTQEILGYISMLLGLSFVYLGIRHDKQILQVSTSETYSFGRGMRTGAGISLLSALIFAIFVVILFIANPGLGDDLINKYVEGLESKGLTQEEMDMAMQRMENVPGWLKKPSGQGFIMFMTVFPLGLIMTLISSFLLRSKKA